MKITKRSLQKILREILLLEVETSYDLYNPKTYIGRGDYNVKDSRIKIANSCSDKGLKKTDEQLVNTILDFSEWLFKNYPNASAPVITSGYRSSRAQADALIVKHFEGDDLMNLYTERCNACIATMGGKSAATKKIQRLLRILDNDLLDENEKLDILEDILLKSPISAHMKGQAVDFRLQHNIISYLDEFLREKGIDHLFEIIEEQKPPHLHFGFVQ